VLSVSTFGEEMVRKKIEVLRSRIWMRAALSANCTFWARLPSVLLNADLKVILAANKEHFEQLGLDEKSLQKTALVLSCDLAVLSSDRTVEEFKEEFLTEEGIKRLMQSVAWHSAGVHFDSFIHFIPIIGEATSASTTYKVLDYSLTRLEKIALCVFENAVKNSSEIIDDSSSDSE